MCLLCHSYIIYDGVELGCSSSKIRYYARGYRGVTDSCLLDTIAASSVDCPFL